MAQGEPIARVEALDPNGWHRKRHNRTHAPQQISGWALAAVSFVYLSVGCPFQLPPKFGAKPLGRFFRRRRRVSSPVDSPTHRFFDGSQHFLHSRNKEGALATWRHEGNIRRPY